MRNGFFFPKVMWKHLILAVTVYRDDSFSTCPGVGGGEGTALNPILQKRKLKCTRNYLQVVGFQDGAPSNQPVLGGWPAAWATHPCGLWVCHLHGLLPTGSCSRHRRLPAGAAALRVQGFLRLFCLADSLPAFEMMGLGNGRRSMKSPPLVLAALVACIIVLGFNYWIASSRSVDLQVLGLSVCMGVCKYLRSPGGGV